MDWEQLFQASASKLKTALVEARAALDHRGLKGSVNEQAVADWLKPMLPGAIDVCTGEVIDSEGGRSKQVDVLLYDLATTPRFLSRGNINVLPVESVFAVLEVKTYLNKTEVENAFENMRALKSLRKVAYHPTKLVAKESTKALLTFYALMSHLLSHADSEPIATHHYLRHIRH